MKLRQPEKREMRTSWSWRPNRNFTSRRDVLSDQWTKSFKPKSRLKQTWKWDRPKEGKKSASKCLLSKDYSLHIHSISEGSAQSGPDDNFRRETNSTGNLKPRHKWSADPDGWWTGIMFCRCRNIPRRWFRCNSWKGQRLKTLFPHWKCCCAR